MKIDILSLIPERTTKGYEIITVKNKRHVTISYKPRFNISKSLKIKRFIDLDNLFFEGFGLIEGDGDKVKFVAFTNSEFSILEHFLNFMKKCFGLSREIFSVRLFLPIGMNLKEAKNKVINELKLKKIVGFNFRKNHKSLVVNLYKRTELIDIVFNNLYKFARNLVKKNKDYAIPYLRGVLAADGTVQRRNTTKSVFAVKISSTNAENTKLYKNLLNLCGFEFGKDERDCIPIRHFRNFSEMEKHNLTIISDSKHKKFTEGIKILKEKKKALLDHGITKDRIIKILAFHGPITAPKLLIEIRKLRESQDRPTLYRHLWELERAGKIEKIGIETIRKPYHRINIWSRTSLSI